jgi:hypothetical protein
MTATSASAWRLTGLIWTGQGAEQGVSLGWLSPVGETRASKLGLGVRLALVVGPDRAVRNPLAVPVPRGRGSGSDILPTLRRPRLLVGPAA